MSALLLRAAAVELRYDASTRSDEQPFLEAIAAWWDTEAKTGDPNPLAITAANAYLGGDT